MGVPKFSEVISSSTTWGIALILIFLTKLDQMGLRNLNTVFLVTISTGDQVEVSFRFLQCKIGGDMNDKY